MHGVCACALAAVYVCECREQMMRMFGAIGGGAWGYAGMMRGIGAKGERVCARNTLYMQAPHVASPTTRHIGRVCMSASLTTTVTWSAHTPAKQWTYSLRVTVKTMTTMC